MSSTPPGYIPLGTSASPLDLSGQFSRTRFLRASLADMCGRVAPNLLSDLRFGQQALGVSKPQTGRRPEDAKYFETAASLIYTRSCRTTLSDSLPGGRPIRLDRRNNSVRRRPAMQAAHTYLSREFIGSRKNAGSRTGCVRYRLQGLTLIARQRHQQNQQIREDVVQAHVNAGGRHDVVSLAAAYDAVQVVEEK